MLNEVRTEVVKYINMREGFVYCVWLGSGHDDEVLRFATQLAQAEGCQVIELTQREILYPKLKSSQS